ncbi:MAG: hypothetical protein ACLQUT_11295, partial [Thermoleophilia bacterium]
TQPAGTATTTPTTSPPTAALSATTAQLVAQATAEYNGAQAALRAGNFAEYGRQITALGQTLAKLK